MFMIVRINDGDGTSSPMGLYEDRLQAVLAVEKEMALYKHFGHKEQDDYWWARDEENLKFRFIIRSE